MYSGFYGNVEHIAEKSTVFGCFAEINRFWLFFRNQPFLVDKIIVSLSLNQIRLFMETKAVITGDIVQSTQILSRSDLLLSIQSIAGELQTLTPFKYEFFRGDSFQLLIDNPVKALKIALLIRAGLQGKTPEGSPCKWDARLSVGLGTVNYTSEHVVTSDGEAYHNSGREFDALGKRKLALRTSWDEVNDEFAVSTAFADDIISGWSVTQAQTIYQSLLYDITQRDVAEKLGSTSQNISKLLVAAKESLLKMYLKRFEDVVLTRL